MDEIHTFNDSRYDLKDQIKFYKENPTYLQAPLFFVLTHLFYPFTKPERDLRILPFLFGTLSIPMFYFLARLFSSKIALPCTLSLTFMTYHISLSQDGRGYALLMFLSMCGLFFFIKHLQTLKNRYLFPGAAFYALSFYTSYSSIPFLFFSQLLWFYKANTENKSPLVVSFILFNCLILIFCAPWLLFIALNYKGQLISHPFQPITFLNLWELFYGIFHDWVPQVPLMLSSAIVLILTPFFLTEKRERRNVFVLSIAFFLVIISLYFFCKLLNITHFLTSKYFISFLPIFFIALYLTIQSIEAKWLIRIKTLKKINLTIIFLTLFLLTNLIILPLYYRAEKQDFRGLVAYLKTSLKEGDKIFDADRMLIGVLHYFQIPPEGRSYFLDRWKITERETEYQKSFIYQNRKITIYHSNICCDQYLMDGNRLWIIAGKTNAKWYKKYTPSVLKGYFDGSFLNFDRFPTDASMYLFLWDPQSPDEKGIDMPIE